MNNHQLIDQEHNDDNDTLGLIGWDRSVLVQDESQCDDEGHQSSPRDQAVIGNSLCINNHCRAFGRNP
jgi:hypothetical protein